MKKKMTYFAPETESMEVRMESNIMSVTNVNGVQQFESVDNTYEW